MRAFFFLCCLAHIQLPELNMAFQQTLMEKVGLCIVVVTESNYQRAELRLYAKAYMLVNGFANVQNSLQIFRRYSAPDTKTKLAHKFSPLKWE